MIDPQVFLSLLVLLALFIAAGVAGAVCYICRVLKKDSRRRLKDDLVIVLDGTEPPPPYDWTNR